MLNLRRLPYIDSNLRGALTLGALLAFILVVAVVGTLRIYTQLDSIASLQRQLVRSQQQLYEVLSRQFDEEIGLRGYLATRQPYFLDPYTAATDDFAAALRRLKVTSRQLDIPGMVSTLDEMDSLHRKWEARVGRPLTSPKPPKDPLPYEVLGKVLVDQLRADANRVSEMLDGRLTQAQFDLRRRINETLGGALLSILVFGVLGMIFVGSRRRMLARIERERRIIETLQRAFRTGWDELPGSRIGTAYVSATRDASVGGDLFDIRRMDRQRGLLIVADVSGKGIEAAVNTAFVKYSIRTLALVYDDPATILAAFNRMFLDTIKDPGLFVVAFVGILDAASLRLTYASAGHSGAFLRRGSDVRQLRVTGPIVGLERDFTYETERVDLEPRDLLVLATDGLTEARDRTGKSLEEAGAMRLLRESPTDPQACADELVSAVRRRSGGRIMDDLALLVVRINEKQPKSAAKQEGEAA
jgi:CHASE3 domain sensor protein